MKKENNVHLYGFLNEIRRNTAPDGKTMYNLAVTTVENYKAADGTPQAKYTNHNVSIASDDKAFDAKMKEFNDDFLQNKEQTNKKTHTISLDGTFTVSKGSNGKTYYGISAKTDDVKFDVKQQEKEVRNSAELKGTISNIDFPEKDGSRLGFANVTIATHYYAPGESENFKGEVKPYTEMTSFVPVRIDEKMMPKTYEDLISGKIEVGDLIAVRGQIHNNNYKNAEGETVYRMVVDLKKAELIAKKGQKKNEGKAETAAETQKETKKDTKAKETKKATPRKKGVTM